MSGRALAHSAAKSRDCIAVLDAFGDRDTRDVANVVCVAANDALAIDSERLIAALAAEARIAHLDIVLGSGFEQAPELAARCPGYGRLYANDPWVVAALKDPLLGLSLLHATGWDVPHTQWQHPIDAHGWLTKEVGGTGGVHIRRAAEGTADPPAYFQRELGGEPLSVTFIADGERAYVLGINRLLVETVGAAPFCYAGAMAGIELAAEARARMQARLDQLVRITALRGLAGIDFLRDGERLVALEINPRPTATFELYDDDFPEGLVHWHLASFERAIPEVAAHLTRQPRACRGLRIIYANRALNVPRGASFPPWCRDLPCAENTIQCGMPVLSIFAEALNVAELAREMDARSQAVRALLASWVAPDAAAIA
jgi:uncharacterized protein